MARPRAALAALALVLLCAASAAAVSSAEADARPPRRGRREGFRLAAGPFHAQSAGEFRPSPEILRRALRRSSGVTDLDGRATEEAVDITGSGSGGGGGGGGGGSDADVEAEGGGGGGDSDAEAEAEEGEGEGGGGGGKGGTSERCVPLDECELCPGQSNEGCEETGRRQRFRCRVTKGEKEVRSYEAYKKCSRTGADEEFLMMRLQVTCLFLGALATMSVRRQKRASASLFDQRRRADRRAAAAAAAAAAASPTSVNGSGGPGGAGGADEGRRLLNGDGGAGVGVGVGVGEDADDLTSVSSAGTSVVEMT